MTVVRRDVKFDEGKAMKVSFERDLELHVDEDILAHKVEEPHIDVEQPHVEDLGVETSTQAKSSREGRNCTREADRFLDDVRENLEHPLLNIGRGGHLRDGSVEKHNAGFVANGFSQVEEIDYDETFAPVARYSLIISILALSAQMGWKIHQMDVMIAFLNGMIEEEVYIEHPEGFEIFNHESHVCRLKRALYGLKQVTRAWYTRIDSYYTRLGFAKSEARANLYHIVVEGKLLIIVLYVDDLILTGDVQLIKYCKEDLAREFEMKDMGLMHYSLGMEVW
eukprot:PITA_14284